MPSTEFVKGGQKILTHAGISGTISLLKSGYQYFFGSNEKDDPDSFLSQVEKTGHMIGDMYLMIEICELYGREFETEKEDFIDAGILISTGSGLMITDVGMDVVAHESGLPKPLLTLLKGGGKVAATCAASFLMLVYCEMRYK